MGERRHTVMAICPASILDRSSSVGAPAARARSDGLQDAMNGTAANTAPTAPVATVARGQKLAPAQVDFVVATTA